MMNSIDPFDPEFDYDRLDDFHAVYTVQLGELIHNGLVNFKDGTWDRLADGTELVWISEEKREEFWAKFKQYYFWREIGEMPYKRWKYDLLVLLAGKLPKYNLMWKALEDGVDPLQDGSEYGKNRNIYSEFPQTMLSDNQDYASSGNDYQFERVREGNFVEAMEALTADYTDPTFALVKELDIMFYSVLTSNINGF